MGTGTTSEKADYYDILGVAREASPEEIKKAYREAAFKFHPDRNEGDEAAEEKFKEAAEAYDVLKDTEKRARYDRYGHDGLQGVATGDFSSFEDIFEAFGDIFGGGGGGIFDAFFGGGGGRRGGRRGPRRGASLKVEITLGLEEALKGQEKTIELTRREACETCEGSGAKDGAKPVECATCGGVGEVIQAQGFFRVQTTCPHCRGAGSQISDPCGTCKGSGKEAKRREITLRIPAGVEDGSRIRISGEGDSGEPGGPQGDLFCFISVKPHEVFERHGNDLICEVPISFPQAVLGAEVEIQTLDGPVAMKIKPATRSGQVYRMSGLGAPDVHGRGRGDLLVQVDIDVPRKVTDEQRDLLKELAKLEKSAVRTQKRTFIERLRDAFLGD